MQGVAHQARLRQYQKITDGALLPLRLNVPELSNLEEFSMTSQLSLISREIDGEIIHLRAKDGYINATSMCRTAGKLLSDYTRLKTTQEFLTNYHAIWEFPYRS